MKYAATLSSVLCCLAIPVAAQIVHVWDLADTAQTGQFTVYNPDVNDAEFGTPITAGDLDGDGRDDLLVGAFYADAPERADAGKLYIFSAELIARLRAAGGRLDLAQRPWPEGLITVIGAERDSR